jgi:hypothetical protein
MEGRKSGPASRQVSEPASAGYLLGREEGQGQVGGGLGTAARGFFEGGVAAVEGVFGLLAVQDLLDGEDLQPGVGGAVGGFIEAGFGGFLVHGAGWLLEAEKNADLGFLAVDYCRDLHS